jgi:hypothetical protein
MRPCFLRWLLIAIFVIPRASAAEAPASFNSLAPEQYLETIDQCLAAVRAIKSTQAAGDLLRSLPPEWHVKAEETEFAVSTDMVRQNLAEWQEKQNQAALDRASQYLETLREDAQAYETRASDFSARHAQLNDILSRREFQNVHGQTWLDRFKQRIFDLLIRILGRAFTSPAMPALGSILVYGLIAIAVAAVVYWMYRSLRDSAHLETIMPVAVPVSAKQWSVWMSEARLAASRADWRNAVHLAYWAGISFLEAKGSWRPDQARTPREYLRLLPATSQHQPVLLALTRHFEAAWYGMHDVGPEGFAQTVTELEKLGCPCN